MRHAWIAIALTTSLAAACTDGPETPADRMRGAYATTQQVDVGGFSWQVEFAMEDAVLYAAGSNKLVQIDRATGLVRELVVSDDTFALHTIASDAAAVYVRWQPVGGGERLVRIPRDGGEPQTLFERHQFTIRDLRVHAGVVYALGDEQRGTGPGSTWHTLLIAVPTTGGETTVLAEVEPSVISAFTVSDDGIFVGHGTTSGWVTRIPLAGGEPLRIQDSSTHYVREFETDATGVYWILGTNVPAVEAPTVLYHLPTGATTPVEVAAPEELDRFALNHLGFYWVSDGRVRAIANEDLAGEPFTLLTPDDTAMDLVADDHGLAYATDDGDGDGGDLELHLIPLHE